MKTTDGHIINFVIIEYFRTWLEVCFAKHISFLTRIIRKWGQCCNSCYCQFNDLERGLEIWHCFLKFTYIEGMGEDRKAGLLGTYFHCTILGK